MSQDLEWQNKKGKMPMKLLMALMYMDIGGAETHVLELCKALKRRGVDLYVVSNGGVYEQELLQNGVKHFRAPLHNKNIGNMIKSYLFLKKVIQDNDIHLVHAHARIPAFLCGLLQKKLNFRFVTTVHGVYNTSFPYRFLTNWGEKTFAVSDDLKRYLIKNYNLPENDIYMTINGIDTSRFSKNTDSEGLRIELGISPESHVILNLSRMDTDMTMPTYALIDSAQELSAKYAEIDIVIVGKGDDLEQVQQRADEVNKKIGKNILHVEGGRIDVHRFFAITDIFVGVSRSAMEAMAAECPIVLAGNQGFIGIFDESTLEAGIDTNFCCRGYKEVTKPLVLQDLVTLLDANEEKRKQLGMFGRQIILDNYSVEKMAEDALRLYEVMRKPNKSVDVVITGYYGTNNHGDDALLKAITDDLRTLKPDISITVISNRPNETKYHYPVNSVHRFQFIKIFKLLKRTNLLIFGGGTLVQDLTSSQSLYYYMYVIKLALRRGAKVMLYANGIGPVCRKMNRKLARETLQYADLITLRDDASVESLKELGVNAPEVVLTADPVFSIYNTDHSSGEKILKELGLNDKKFFCVAIRSWKYLKEGFEQDIVDFCDYIMEKYSFEVLFVPMQRSFDFEISKRIMHDMKKPSYIIENFSANDLLGIMERTEFLAGMRLHTIIYAAKMGTPVVGLVYDPKVRGMMDTFNQPYCLEVSDFKLDTLKQYADEVIQNKDEISKNILSIACRLETKARENAVYAFKILNRDVF